MPKSAGCRSTDRPYSSPVTRTYVVRIMGDFQTDRADGRARALTFSGENSNAENRAHRRAGLARGCHRGQRRNRKNIIAIHKRRCATKPSIPNWWELATPPNTRGPAHYQADAYEGRKFGEAKSAGQVRSSKNGHVMSASLRFYRRSRNLRRKRASPPTGESA